MDSARWDQIQALFHEALERPESERQAFLEAACGDDSELMAEVLTMLKVDSRSASLLDRGLPDVAYRMIGSPLDSLSFREFGPYRLQRMLGEGGMGVVWLAEREDTGNLLAIKFLPHAGLSPARRERFAREIKMLAKLKHPFIARLYDAGTLADGTPWFVMEYVEGERFTEYCRKQERPLEERLRLFRMVCEAVQYAHGQEIIHRDLKPSNILVERDGTPRLLDFGIARELHNLDEPPDQTRPGLRFLSPDYAAPEWARDGIVGFYTDVYSLGVILYEMLAGQLPAKNVGDEAEKPSVRGKRTMPLSKAAWNDLDVLCLKAMNNDPRQRYQSVEALIRDIDHYLKREPLEAQPDTLRYRLGKFIARNRRAVLATSLASALLVCLVVFFTLRLAKERNTALAEATRTRHIQRFMLSMFGADPMAGPADDLRVVTILDRGVQGAQSLKTEPAVQAELYQTLGGIYQTLGNLDRADSLLQSGLERRKSIFGQDSQEVAGSLVALSLLRVDQARFAEAERLARQALSIDERARPPDNPARARAMNALASVLWHRGNYGDALKVLDEAVRLQSASSADSTELVDTLTSLAISHHFLGHNTVADSLGRRVLALNRQVYGDHHPSVAEDLSNLAEIQDDLGHYEEAERYDRQGLEIVRSWYGTDHLETALFSAALAKTLVLEGKYDEAEGLLQRALATFERSTGEEHPFVALALNWLGVVALKRGNLDEAEADFRRMTGIFRSVYGEHDSHVAVALSRFGELYLARSQYSRAQQFFGDSVQLFSETLSPDHLKTGAARVELGGVLVREHRYQQAEVQLLAGYRIVTRESSSSQAAADARRNLIATYEALNQPAKATKFRAELAAIDRKSAPVPNGK